MNKITNDEIIKNVKLRKILKYILILLAILTIILAVLSLVINLSPIFACISYIIEVILRKIRNRIPIK